MSLLNLVDVLALTRDIFLIIPNGRRLSNLEELGEPMGTPNTSADDEMDAVPGTLSSQWKTLTFVVFVNAPPSCIPK